MTDLNMFIEILKTVLLPILSALIAWFTNAYRNKQKREGDIMSNFEHMMDVQNKLMSNLERKIVERDETIKDSKNIIKRLESKLDKKNKSIRKANKCKFTNEGEGCPVLLQEEKNEHLYDVDCNNCLNLKNKND